MNTSGKGARIERIAIKHLRSEGYRVHRTLRSAVRYRRRFVSNGNDLFGSVDLLAKKGGERMKYIQVTATRDKSRKAKRLLEVPWDCSMESVEIWRWVGGKGPRMDGRTGQPRPRFYFQVYRLDSGFRNDKSDRIWPKSS